MKQFTIDVQILMNASDLGDPGNLAEDLAFLEAFRANPECLLVLDETGLIRAQYERKMSDPAVLGRQWLAQIFAEARVSPYPRAQTRRPVRVALEREGFVGEDYNYYVRTAAASDSKVVVTHDPHFFGVETILRRMLDVRVLTPRDAEAAIRG